jgi:hypothetical protein
MGIRHKLGYLERAMKAFLLLKLFVSTYTYVIVYSQDRFHRGGRSDSVLVF